MVFVLELEVVPPVPLVEDWLFLVSVPLLSIVRDVLELKLPKAGAGVEVVVSEDELCASAAPVIIANTVMRASQIFVMSCSPLERWRAVVSVMVAGLGASGLFPRRSNDGREREE
jgi:hypothetical protein